MSGKKLEFFYDVVSPTCYLASTQLPAIIERTGAERIDRPMFLGGVMQATGNRPPASVPAKGAYMGKDLQRFANRYGVPLGSNPHFPINTLMFMRVCALLLGTPDYDKWVAACYHSIWVAPRNLNDPAEVAKFVKENGYDPEELVARASAPEVKQALKDTTDEAVERGVFGAPSIFIDGELFFGQDRLDFVEAALS